ncbi:TDP-N-acetylfucosamine:lipid II N-acetylfucosaminyltransferase [Algoriphagus aquimarinus]|uniref:4-alpha-L-fucosyltransferase glycosyl transferase group 56 n=1 Tax=Algoriphagus aquimarinus TaxID=237018 RepID=A0A1I1A0G0_9BACT|nr:TDP-N-acetylfucosamine:lipid II N-acetylfucosaminyltransferase [Algoriphagus aquimarinus]SFB30836.1 4-alpha-L-fucosyltransferase glycosyl transferase group 56 [Algoriphagus aquimarinus]
MKEVLVLLPDSPYSDWIIQKVQLLQGTNYDFACFGVERNYIKSPVCTFMMPGSSAYQEFIKKKNKYDRVVIHYHTQETGFFVEKSQIPSEKLVWVLWSGDLYNSKFYKKPLYLRQTLLWKEANTTELKRNSKLKEYVKSLLGKINSYDYQKSFQRIKYIGTCFPTDVNEADDTFGKCYIIIPHNILSINELFEVNSFATIQSTGTKILLGHSGAVENNHLDGIDLLQKLRISHQILCPLSYGGEEYIKAVISAGNNAFGDKFQPLTAFLPKIEYYQLLTEVGFAVFFLRIQQAFGNILGLLFLGVKIFLPKENSIFIDLRKKGFLLFSIEELSKKAISNGLNEQDRLQNRSLILKLYNEEKIAESYERMYLGSMNNVE